MLYLERKIDEYLEKWKADKNRKPLIVKGPRQVGKTESINRFAEKNYKSVIYSYFILIYQIFDTVKRKKVSILLTFFILKILIISFQP